MEDMNKPVANPELLAAVERMNRENSRESREAVLDLVITTARFLAPVTITPAPQEQVSGQAALGQDTQIQFQLLANQEGQPFFPAFTSWEELRKLCGPKNQQTLVLTFDDYSAMVVRDVRAAGFVVDPFGASLSFDRAMVEHLVERKRQMTGN
ncbi:SseB family protein [Pseudoflavonifractor phocaeensis]|uniref:SseB family protein n=1 Tax=Pseudoflavonifractor phocaeensis TaxID=1870988 RepID=UPI001F370A10|nr:SseB family protein [Pseudoflavonifractor phocaeensis]MCF2661459.1 SseB family protein [Pseudoflavonifractor phocaeensis]